ncbi:hypothetical protein [Desulforhabdus amnigena]|nr:hypothetical protein [Desulforhabdus amnigena]
MSNRQRSVLDDLPNSVFNLRFMVWIDYEMADHNRTVKHTSKEPLLTGK